MVCAENGLLGFPACIEANIKKNKVLLNSLPVSGFIGE